MVEIMVWSSNSKQGRGDGDDTSFVRLTDTFCSLPLSADFNLELLISLFTCNISNLNLLLRVLRIRVESKEQVQTVCLSVC